MWLISFIFHSKYLNFQAFLCSWSICKHPNSFMFRNPFTNTVSNTIRWLTIWAQLFFFFFRLLFSDAVKIVHTFEQIRVQYVFLAYYNIFIMLKIFRSRLSASKIFFLAEWTQTMLRYVNFFFHHSIEWTREKGIETKSQQKLEGDRRHFTRVQLYNALYFHLLITNRWFSMQSLIHFLIYILYMRIYIFFWLTHSTLFSLRVIKCPSTFDGIFFI